MNRSIYRNFVFFYESQAMEEVQKPISRNCNIALSASCKTDNLNCSLGRAQDLKHYGNSMKRRRRD